MSELSDGSRIALVEDNPADVYLFRRALREKGIRFDLTLFEDGNEAVKGFSEMNGDPVAVLPDLIVMDLNLPRVRGIEVISRVRKLPRLKNVPIVVLTSSETPGELHQAHSLGIARCLRKPTLLEEFLEHVGQGVKELLPAR